MSPNLPQFGVTQQGRPRLYYQGFAYNFNSSCGISEYWRCASKNCKGWVVKRGNLYRVSKQHTCVLQDQSKIAIAVLNHNNNSFSESSSNSSVMIEQPTSSSSVSNTSAGLDDKYYNMYMY